MAGGALVDAGSLKRAHLYEYKITNYFIFSCIVGALGGSLFGYDLGVSGKGVLLQNDIICMVNNISRCHMNVMNMHVDQIQKYD